LTFTLLFRLTNPAESLLQ